MSRASTSGVKRAKAFLEPSGLERDEMLAIRSLMLWLWRAEFPTPCVSGGHIPDQGVDLDGVNVIQLLNSSLDLALVGLDIDDEDQGVVLLDLLHGALSVERVQNDLLSVELGLTGDGDAGVLGRPRELQGLGAVEGGRGANLAGLVKLLVGG